MSKLLDESLEKEECDSEMIEKSIRDDYNTYREENLIEMKKVPELQTKMSVKVDVNSNKHLRRVVPKQST